MLCFQRLTCFGVVLLSAATLQKENRVMLGFTRMLLSAIVCLSLLVGTVCGASDLPPWIVEKGLQGDPRVGVGCLPVTLYDGWEGNAVDPTGKKDSTKAIRQAIHDAYQFDMVCFFPTGTYLVSDTLECVQRVIPRKAGKDNKNYFPAKKEFTLVGSTKGARPVIKLANHSESFLKDWRHPIRVNFFPAASICLLLLAIAYGAIALLFLFHGAFHLFRVLISFLSESVRSVKKSLTFCPNINVFMNALFEHIILSISGNTSL